MIFVYELLYSDYAEKQLGKLPQDVRERILATLERCRIRPFVHAKKLVGNPYFSIRVGDYRVIANIINNELKIFVIEVGHRKNVYG